MPALRTAQITGRGGELEVNENGTKTMKTGGTKTVYSWYNGGIISTTRSAKTTADNLKNPLGGFDEYSKLLNGLIKKTSINFLCQTMAQKQHVFLYLNMNSGFLVGRTSIISLSKT
jgi:hypothetical protein